MRLFQILFSFLVLTLFSCPSHVDVGNPLVNKTKLMQYLTDRYGHSIISGQMDLAWEDSIDMFQRVHNDTGKYPALAGFDFMNELNSSGSGTSQVEEAIAWWNGTYRNLGGNGIVTFCWHWRMANNGSGTSDFYTTNTAYRIPYDIATDSWISGTNYDNLMSNLDTIAILLQTLETAGVPILWRPLHEASGAWFWWGASGAEAYIALYRMMYNYFTVTKGLSNLIWVANGQNASWYPGDDFVDIISEDIYPGAKVYESQYAKWNAASQYSDNPTTNPKIVALSENGSIPDPDSIEQDGAWWSWFMTWNDGATAEGVTDGNNFWTGEYHNEGTHKDHVYGHALIITRDELPNLETYGE